MNKFIFTEEAAPFTFRWVLFCFLFLLLSSCSENTVYQKNIPITNHIWSQQQVPEFKAHITNTDQNVNISLNLRHSSKYKYENLSLLINEISPKNQKRTYRVELQLARPDGLWKGTGTADILNYQVPIVKNHQLTDTGTYTFKIHQNMSINPLPEILDIGIRIANTKLD